MATENRHINQIKKLEYMRGNTISKLFKQNNFKILCLLVTAIFFIITSYVAFIVDNPSADFDLLFYFYVGEEILHGDKENVRIYNAPIGWPVLLASSNFFIQDPFVTAKLFSVIFGSGIVFMSYFIIRNVFGERVGIVGQSLIAVTPLLHVETIITHTEMLPTFLIFISFYFITKKELIKKDIILCAIFLGGSFMIRPQSLFIAVGTIMFILLCIKKQKKNFLFYFILFFLISISPLLIYNISITGNMIDNDPISYQSNFDIVDIDVFKNQSIEELIGNNVDGIKTNFKNYFISYLDNLIYYHPHLLLNLGLGHNNFSILPFIAFAGIIFVFGGIAGNFMYDFKKKYLTWIFGGSIILCVLLVLINKIEDYFLLLVILPVLLVGVFSFKRTNKNFWALLIIPIFFLLSISFVRIGGGVDMFALLIIPSAFSASFIIKVIPSIILKIQKISKIKSTLMIKISVIMTIIVIISLNLMSSLMLEKHQLYGEDVNYHNLLELEKKYELNALRYAEIGEILSTESDIENKIVMASSNDYAHYAKSKYLYTNFSEGIKNDTINSFITRENWSKSEINFSNAVSIPPDKYGKQNHMPDYLIYDDNISSMEKFQIFKNSDHIEIPNNFELIYKSNKTGIVVYKIKH